MKPSRLSLRTSALFHGRLCSAATLVISLCASSLASATSATWLASPVDGTWNSATNWSVAAFPNGTGDSATFNVASTFGGSSSPVTPSVAVTIQNMNFAAAAGPYVVGVNGGSAIIVRGGGSGGTPSYGNSINIAAAVTNSQVVAAPISFSAPSSTTIGYTFKNDSTTAAATLTLSGAITANTATNRSTAISLDGANTGNNTLSGVITTSLATSGVSNIVLKKEGVGTWILAGANVFSGANITSTAGTLGIQVNAGVLSIQNNQGLGTSGTANNLQTWVNSGAKLELANNITLDNGVSLNLRSGGTIRSSGSTTTNGRITLGAIAATSATLSTVGSGDVFTIGNAANDFTGGLSDTVTHIAGPGTVMLGQASNYAGTVSVDAGTLHLGNATALGTATSAGIGFGSGSTGKVWLDGISVTVATLNTNAAVGTPVIENNNSTAATLTVSSTSGTSTYAGILQDGAAGTLGLAKSGANTLSLAGANTYTGTTAVTGGILQVTGSLASSAVTLGSSSTLAGTGTLAGTVTVALGSTVAPGSGGIGTLSVGGLTLNSGSLLAYDIASTASHDQINVTTSGALTINGGAVTLNGGANFSANGVYNLIGYSGAIGGSGVGALSLANSPVVGKTYTFGSAGGFVTLTVADSAAAVNYWNADSDGSWGTGADWSVGSAPNTAGTFAALGGGGTPITAPRTITVASAYTVGTLSFNNATSAYTLADGGGGSLILDGDSASASVTATAGSHGIAVPLVTNSFGATFSTVGAADTLTVSGVISGNGKLTKGGNGTLVLTGSNTYLGGTAISAGTVTVNSSTSLGDASGAVSIGAATLKATASISSLRAYQLGDVASTLAVDAAATLTLNGVIADGSAAGTLNKTGAGTLALTGANTFTGGTLVSAGTLSANGDAALGAVATLTLNSGTKLQAGAAFALGAARGVVLAGGSVAVDTNSYAINLTGAVSGSGALDKTGTGTLTLSGTNTYAGGTLVDGGMLVIGNSIVGGITLADATTLSVPTGGIGNAITLSGTNANATFLAAGVSNGSTGSVSGSADQKLTLGGTTQVSFGATTKQFQGLLGTVAIPTGATLRFGATSLANGGDSTTFDVNGFLTTRNNGNVALGALTGAGTVTMGVAGSVGQHVTYTIGAKAITALFSGVIADGNTANGQLVAVTKTGAGIQTLTGADTFSGGLFVNAGILQCRAQSLGAGSVAVTGGHIELGWFETPTATYTSANPVTINGGGLYAWDAYQHLSGTIAIGASGGSLGSSFNNAGADTNKGLFVDGVLSGTGALTVQQTYGGTNAWETSIVFLTNNANTYAGTLSVNANSGGGVYVALDAANALASATLNLTGSPGGAKQFGNSQLVFTTNLGGAATLGALTGSGDVALSEYDPSAHTVAATPVALTVGGNNATTTYSGILSGGGSLTKSGTGALTLGGANTYTGDTTVTAGILAVNGTSLADSGKLVITGGQVQATGTETVASLYFGAVQQVAGTWGATGSGAANINDTCFAGTAGVVLVTSGSGPANYASWAATHGVTGGLTADSDHDGISNAVEYALNLNYAGSDGSVGTLTGNTLSFTKRAEAVANGDVTYTIEASIDMVTWAPVTPEVDNATTISYNLPAGMSTVFARLNVTIATP